MWRHCIKKVFFPALFSVLLILSVPVNAYADSFDQYVVTEVVDSDGNKVTDARVEFNDSGNLYEEEYNEIKEYAEEIAKETGWNIGLEYDKFGDFRDERDAFNYCVKQFEIIFGKDATGVYYYFADHYTYLITSGDAQYYISKGEAGRTARLGDSSFKQGKLVQSVKEVLSGVKSQYLGGRDNAAGGHEDEIETENDRKVFIGFTVVIAILAAVIFCAALNSSYKNKMTPSVKNYVNKGEGIQYPISRDIFVRTYTTTHTQSSGSGGGGGGGFSSGGHTGGGGHR